MGDLIKITLTSLIAALACTGIIYAATTVGTNISTGGTLSVTGNATFTTASSTGMVKFANINSDTGAISFGDENLSTTGILNVTGLTTLGNASTSVLSVSGNTYLATITATGDMAVAGKVALTDTTVESINEGEFATITKWSETGDFDITGGKAMYVHSTGVGELIQLSADMATAPVGSTRYVLQFQVDNVIGSPVVLLESVNGLVSDDVTLDAIHKGMHSVKFTSDASPTDFRITVTSSAGDQFSFDRISLFAESVAIDGSLSVGGDLIIYNETYTDGPDSRVTITNSPVLIRGSSRIGEVHSQFGLVEIFGEHNEFIYGGSNVLYVEQDFSATSGTSREATLGYYQMRFSGMGGSETFDMDVVNQRLTTSFNSVGTTYTMDSLSGSNITFSELGTSSGTYNMQTLYGLWITGDLYSGSPPGSSTYNVDQAAYMLKVGTLDDLANGTIAEMTGVYIGPQTIGTANYGLVLDGANTYDGTPANYGSAIMFGASQEASMGYESNGTGRLSIRNNLGGIALKSFGDNNGDGTRIMPSTATQTIAAGDIIVANRCGGVKLIDSVGNVDTSTAQPITWCAGADAYSTSGCLMHIINADTTDTITIKSASLTNIQTRGSQKDIVLTPNMEVSFYCDGTAWRQLATEAVLYP